MDIYSTKKKGVKINHNRMFRLAILVISPASSQTDITEVIRTIWYDAFTWVNKNLHLRDISL